MNKFEYYTKVAEHEMSSYEEAENILALIQRIEACRSIYEVKTLLKNECNITEDVLKKSIGTFAQITIIDKPSTFIVLVEYSNEVHTCIFPKLEKGV